MEELKKNLENEELTSLYDTYLKLVSLLESLDKSIKNLPPKEEL